MSNALYRFTSASFNPEQISVMTEAFEKAWVDVAGNFSPAEVPVARERLAEAILRIASGWPHDVKSLTDASIRELRAEIADARLRLRQKTDARS